MGIILRLNVYVLYLQSLHLLLILCHQQHTLNQKHHPVAIFWGVSGEVTRTISPNLMSLFSVPHICHEFNVKIYSFIQHFQKYYIISWIVKKWLQLITILHQLLPHFSTVYFASFANFVIDSNILPKRDDKGGLKCHLIPW